MTTPGETAYNAYTAHVHSNGVTERIDPYASTTLEVRKKWEAIAAAVLAAHEKVCERMPEHYVDLKVLKAEHLIEPTDHSILLKLEARVPAALANHFRPGSTMPKIHELLQLVHAGSHVLRIAAIADAEVLSELARLNPDGTVRQFLENEATW